MNREEAFSSLFPSPVVLCAVTNTSGKRVLLIRRKTAPYRNYWVLPGGKWEAGEELEEAVIREVSEETEHNLEHVELLAILSEELVTISGNVKNHFLLFFCEGATTEMSESLPTREGECRWFDMKHVPLDHLLPTDRELLDLYVIRKATVNRQIRYHNVVLQESLKSQYRLLKFESKPGGLQGCLK